MSNNNNGITLIVGIILSIAVGGGLLIFALMALNSGENEATNSGTTIVDGKQEIVITAKGGYSPRVVNAKAGVPTVLKIKTNATYDCSSALVIPKLGFNSFLEPTGIKTIEISAEKAKGTIDGLCSMGMYSFKINFN